MEKMYDFFLQIWEHYLLPYLPKILIAIAIWFIGNWIINIMMRLFKRVMKAREVEETLRKFLSNLVGWILKIVLLVAVVSQLGVETTSFVAILGAAGLAVGLALQGSLSNFAGGILIILFKPFKLGDFIEAQGEAGTVKDIQIFVTKLTTPDNKVVIIPNGALSNGNITNYSMEEKRRVSIPIGIAYNSDIKKAKDLLIKVLLDHPKVLDDPAPMVVVTELADSSVNLSIRAWSATDDYWEVYFDLIEQAKTVLDKNGIEIPFPQRDIHIRTQVSQGKSK